MANWNFLKDKYLEARRESFESGNSNTVFTPKMLSALNEMAKHDVWPDGRFGDDDCNIWSMMHLG